MYRTLFRISLLVALLAVAAVATGAPADAHARLPAANHFEADPPWRVAPNPEIDIEAAIAPWNRLSQRDRGIDLFVVDAQDPQVFVYSLGEPGRSFAHYPAPHRQRCVIYLATEQPAWVLQHEFGHCAGLDDHIPSDYVDPDDGVRYVRTASVGTCVRGRINLYRGIMSYCTMWDEPHWTFRFQDRWAVHNLLNYRARTLPALQGRG